PPLTGDRHAGEYYPACRAKCGEVLPYMLQGLSVDPAPPLEGAASQEEPRLVYEDPWLLVVDKPRGLLSVPGRHSPLRDSALVRLRRRDPEASGPLVVHALEAEDSGLLLVARDRESHAALQRQFARCEADRRHVAWLDGHVAGEQGVVALPLRGKRALTEWRVTQRTERWTQVALVPRTALPHQLRLHAADPLGLGAPIVMLHAEALSFLHPHTGKRLELYARQLQPTHPPGVPR
ncbi:MAG TPA: pseudouridine synthase, partial [Archangium sp.]|nr:pseudouridine synthase [Archangium sp.]